MAVPEFTGDGLTAFKRVGGSEGASVVADLAKGLPAPTDAGRTYSFVLRHGIRYSTGALVEPRDLRHALERDLQLGSPGSAYYTSIVGASSCSMGRRCDLSRGVVVGAHTIVFHLVAPDPEFLERLALPFAYAVPSATPDHVVAKPLPATGAYVVSEYVPNRRLKLVRNPHFHEWSAAARPDGYPDAILEMIGMTRDDATTAVEHDRLDYAPGLALPRLDEVVTRYAGQLAEFRRSRQISCC